MMRRWGGGVTFEPTPQTTPQTLVTEPSREHPHACVRRDAHSPANCRIHMRSKSTASMPRFASFPVLGTWGVACWDATRTVLIYRVNPPLCPSGYDKGQWEFRSRVFRVQCQ